MRHQLLILLLATVTPASAGQAPPAGQPGARAAQAYEQFLLARRLEDSDDADGAVAAYRRAMVMDADAAGIPAALAELYVRMDRVDDAIAVAEQALKIDSTNREAHRVLGTIYASRASSRRADRAAQRQNLDLAIQHLEQAVQSPPGGLRADANLRAMLARMYYGAGSFDKAIPLLLDLVKEEPSWQDGASLLADAYTAAGREGEAIAWLEEAALDNPELYGTLADFYARVRRWPEAVATYDRALQLSPRSVDLRLRYASTLLSIGGAEDLEHALEVLHEAARLRPEDERVLFMLSQAERRAGDLDSAEATARRLIELNNRNPRAFAALAETLEQRRHYQGVVEALAPAVERFRAFDNSTFPLALLLPHLGFAYQQTGDLTKAVSTFEEAVKLTPHDAAALGYLAQSLIATGNHAKALSVIREGRAEHPDDLGLARLEARALNASGERAEGVAVLEGFLKTQPDNPDAHLALARAYGDAGRAEEAIKVLEAAAEQFPSETVLTFELGAAFEREHRYAEAESAFRRVIASDPNHSPALNYLGYMFAEQGERLDESVDLIKRALEIEPDNGSYLDSLGWAYFKDGRLDLAEEYLRRAADQLTRNSVVQDHFGDVLFQLGRFREAMDAWRVALDGDGENVDRASIGRKIENARRRLER